MTKSRSQIGRSSVRSGKRLENRYANMWTDWTGETFRRRRIEGRGESVTGLEGVADVICTSATCKFAIESKKEKTFSFTATPFSDSSKFWSWWIQASVDAMIRTMSDKKHHYMPFVHFKPTPNHDYIAISRSALSKLVVNSPIAGYEIVPSFDTLSEKVEVDGKIIEFQIKPTNVLLTTWKNFITSVDPKSVFYG